MPGGPCRAPEMIPALQRIRALIVDMDGVLWRGDQPLPGLQDFFAYLERRPLAYVLATNNASREPAYYVAKLARLGVAVGEDRILTSALATADWLRGELPAQARLFVLGQEGLRQALLQAGFQVTTAALTAEPPGLSPEASPEPPLGEADPAAALPRANDRLASVEAVVVGIDFNLSYRALRDATLLIRHGARFIGTNGDLTYPSELGLVPGAGSILAALQAATGVAPTIIGKPERHLFEAALRLLGEPPDRTAMLGDRLDTDILGAQRVGLATILVTTGVDDEASARRVGIQPDLIVSSLQELVAHCTSLSESPAGRSSPTPGMGHGGPAGGPAPGAA